MRYNIVGTGSTGNCIIIEDILMLDCGLAYSKVKPYLDKIKVIFISHVLNTWGSSKKKHNKKDSL